MIEHYKLDNNSISEVSDKIIEVLTEMNINRKEILKISLGIEETLLRFKERFGDGLDFEIKCVKKFGKINVSLSVESQMWDPFAKNSNIEEDSVFMRAALANMGELPIWRYIKGENVITYTIAKKQSSSWTQLIIAIIMVVIVAIILNFCPKYFVILFRDEVLSPLLDTFMNLLSAIAGPMIFLSVTWGIYGIGDVSLFSLIGKRLFKSFVIFCSILTVIVGLISIHFFSVSFGNQQLSVGFSEIFHMILDIVPGNIVKPFLEGNTLQILFLAIVMGITMIIIGEKTQTVAMFAEQLNYIVQLIMEFISKLVPVFVFGSLLSIVLNNEMENINESFKLFFVNIFGCIVILFAYIIIICIKYKMSPITYIKKLSKPFLICLATASSSAAFSTSISTCVEEYGLEQKFVNFGVPFAQTLYAPTCAKLYFTSAIYAAEMAGMDISGEWVAIAILTSILLSIATPSIPGGTIASISVMFAQLSLPMDCLAVVIAINIIIDFIDTPVDVTGGHAILILLADKFGLLDKNKLKNTI